MDLPKPSESPPGVQPYTQKLTTHPPVSRLAAWALPGRWILFGLLQIPATIYRVAVLERRPLDLLRFSRWQGVLFDQVWSGLAPLEEKDFLEEKKRTASGCRGIVIDVGPGNNPYLEYFDKSKVSHIYGVEPNRSMHKKLLEQAKSCGWAGRYTLVPCGIEDSTALYNSGIPAAGVDTIVSIQCLCSTPASPAIYRALYRLLKPGGELRLFEHVRSRDRATARIQELYNIVWPIPFGGCSLARPTSDWLQNRKLMEFKETDNWDVVDLEMIQGESPWTCMPMLSGRMVKTN